MAPEKQPLKLYSHKDTPLFPGNVLSKEKIVFSSVCLSVCLSPSLSSVPWKHLNKEKKMCQIRRPKVDSMRDDQKLQAVNTCPLKHNLSPSLSNTW